ncbi:MAG TPA: fatty acid desaturase [Verrucomicrobiae bacterium]|jgi:alkane 1-monooxygenase|nr:fatty acid desaturase [Verrucomicrobiae bacterium]
MPPTSNTTPSLAPSNAIKRTAQKGKYRHLIFCFLPLSVYALLALGIRGGGYWLLLPIVFLLVLMPLLDLITGWHDTAHFDNNDFNRLEVSLLNWNTRLFALLQMGFVIYLAVSIRRFDTVEIGLLLVCLSLFGGIAFSAAHELVHAKQPIDQVLQRVLTSFLFYPHYKLIHIRSHHVHTSTDYDENTAWLNETIYSYIGRTIPGSAVRCWQMENKYAKQQGVAIFQNKMYLFAAGQLIVLAAMFLLSGVWGLLFYLVLTIGSHIVLESVNYIQHYGLMRQQREGEYEKTGAEHSWDTYHYFSSYMTFRVGHHSYHHIAVKPYYLLGTEAESPKLPVGYFWAIPLVFLPPCWRGVINPRLKANPLPA